MDGFHVIDQSVRFWGSSGEDEAALLPRADLFSNLNEKAGRLR